MKETGMNPSTQRRGRATARGLARLAPLAIAAAAALCGAPQPAEAFCGFYVAGADTKLFNNATMVVLMREGTRTVLSMQNNYQGPPENFAMVVPVPVVLQKENVKTLPREVFNHIDTLAAPRLVEYWEQDPCGMREGAKESRAMPAPPMAAAPGGRARAEDLGVKIEAQFTVGEYEIVILSASNSLGLDTWLRESGYKIPDGAEPLLRPYVQGGMKFFVAKVDVSKVRFEKGMAMLSPLRFHYDTDTFNLPVRLGLVNSAGTQDLIVHILAKQQRYEVANYKNVTIPTNLDVAEKARDQFAEFYAALFDRTLEENPGSVVTEYAWDASSCDPCPSPTLTPQELATLGADVLPSADGDDAPSAPPGVTRPGPGGASGPPSPPVAPRPGRWRPPSSGFVLTRLHARYGKASLGEDLVFRAAPPIAGGREVRGASGKLEEGSTPGSGINNFQGRYAIRHPWTGAVECANPRRGVWGGPPSGVQGNTRPKAAQDLAFAPRGGVKLASFLDIPVMKTPSSPAPKAADPKANDATGKSCGACRVGGGATGTQSPGELPAKIALFAGIAAAITRIVRRRQRPRRG
jgi:hypothetical protein